MVEHPQLQIDPDSAGMSVIDNSPIKVKRAGIVARLLHGTGAGTFAYGLRIGSNLLLPPHSLLC